MSERAPRFAIWSVDWEDIDQHHYTGRAFADACRPMHDLLAELTGGCVTWFAKVDWVSDITDHDGVERLARDIVASGGEIGLHTHHFSWEPYWRERLYRRGQRELRERCGVEAVSYSSGMGNYVDTDTPTLVSLGFRAGRLTYPWLKHDFREWFDKPYAGLAGMDMENSEIGPLAGYVDPASFHRYTNVPTIVNFPQVRLPEYRVNPDNQFQLTIGVNTPANTDRIVAFAKASSRYVHAYCHPYDLMARGSKLAAQCIENARHLASVLRAEGYEFVTVAQAVDAFASHGELSAPAAWR